MHRKDVTLIEMLLLFMSCVQARIVLLTQPVISSASAAAGTAASASSAVASAAPDLLLSKGVIISRPKIPIIKPFQSGLALRLATWVL